MSKIKNAFKLSNKVGIIVPSTIGANTKGNEDTVKFNVRQVMKTLSEMFGGASTIKQEGAWVSEEHGLIVEENTLVYAYAEELNDSILNKVLEVAEALGQAMEQEAIAVEINNEMYFV